VIKIGKILLIEDHPLVRAGCCRVLRSTGAVVFEAATGTEGRRLNREEQPDIVFLDISLPDVNGADMLGGLRADSAGTRVIFLTMYEDRALANRLLKRGAAGYVTKSDSPECMLKAIEQVCGGGSFMSAHLTPGIEVRHATEDRLASLSPRDRKIVDLLGEGKSLAEASYELGQSYKTVANVTNMIRHKLGLRTNAALIRLAVEQRLTQSPEVGES
jgi:two-component system invasion response regulator UvrY